MTTDNTTYTPGTLVRARGRDWVVEADSESDLLHLRPLAGATNASCWLLPTLEQEAPCPAKFPPPNVARRGNNSELNLLQSAMRMRLRSGAGPFRSFANLSVQPRAYQLVPLLMALRMQVIRLLIADDVGVGKTIEAGLILREMLDRGEVQRFSVLCPPNLAAQWQAELAQHFNISAKIVSSSSITRLEKSIPPGHSVFEDFPYTIISLDYIKSDSHRASFLNKAPEMIIVDEAHTCTSVTKRNQQRYDLVRTLANDKTRHMLLLTATPHSGIEEGFYHLLGLLDKDFEEFGDVDQAKRNNLRERLARRLVQRRRENILQCWEKDRSEKVSILPHRVRSDATYKLAGPWGDFFEDVRQYCEQEAHKSKNRMIWYAMLNLLRCISSSPAAAVSALQTRLSGVESPDSEEDFFAQFADSSESDDANDREAPAPNWEHLSTLLTRAEKLRDSGDDPKIAALRHELEDLLRDKYSPIVFCQFISTAEYVAEKLQKLFPKYTVKAVTGNILPGDRAQAVRDLIAEEKHILVATNCLSEGINLQDGFNAVVHYDLEWNPTRHEQREGRVDRFGQLSPEVRCVMMYGKDNPIDGVILKVILRKARTIDRELGVAVPVPIDGEKIGEALVHAVLHGNQDGIEKLRQEEAQAYLPGFGYFGDMAWSDASERGKKPVSIFAQKAMDTKETSAEYERVRHLLGSTDELRNFLQIACKRLGAPLEPIGRDTDSYRLRIPDLPETLIHRLREAEIEQDRKTGLCRFTLLPAGSELPSVTRAHPLVSVIADYLAEQSLEKAPDTAAPDPATLPRCAVVLSSDVEKLTTLYNLRLRHILSTSFRRKQRQIVVEELVTLVRRGSEPPHFASQEELKHYDGIKASGNIPDVVAERLLKRALEYWQTREHSRVLTPLLTERAAALQSDHERVRREARADAGSVQVTCCPEPDLLSLIVYQPSNLSN